MRGFLVYSRLKSVNQHLPLRLRYLLIGLILSLTNGDRDVKKILVVLLVSLFSLTAMAANKPCSGKKGGISHCSGEKFVCNDGTISKSKKACQR